MRLRANPQVELQQLGQLAAGQREMFRDLEADPDFYGLLVPKPPLAMHLQSAPRRTAELFRSLQEPGTLPDEVLCDAEDIVDLVLDGILEIESNDGFVSGADALPILCDAPPPPLHDDATGRLSHEALLHAHDLETSDPDALTAALYLYNRLPWSAFWEARFPDGDAILSHLGADRAPLRLLLDRDWIASGQPNGWLHWSARTPRRQTPNDVTYKLYISPRLEQLRDTFEVLVRVLCDFPASSFKVGGCAAGLLRPDKLVAYFATREDLAEAAAQLRRKLAGVRAHGVPFTAAIDEDGLLSWGVDPPDEERALKWLGRDSWRMWVARRLGAALSISKRARTAAAVEPWAFALARARRHGIDVDAWVPTARLWSAA